MAGMSSNVRKSILGAATGATLRLAAPAARHSL
jgi:hypothetical protein